MRPNRREFTLISLLTLAGLALPKVLRPRTETKPPSTQTNKREALMRAAESGNIEWRKLLSNEAKVTATLARHNIINPNDSFFDIVTVALNARGDYPQF